MNRLRVYVDTSVVGGCLDEEFAEESRALLEMARRGEIVIVTSDLLLEELARAPKAVQQVLSDLPRECVEAMRQSDASLRLCQAYLDAGVVSPQSESDAHHVALSTIARADVIVSWNFKHIVHLDKIRLFNAVNLREGYPMVDIRSPKEMV
jgi:predicted nucleic acid-binding protein